MDDKITYKVVKTFDQVPKESWDAMVTDNPYMSWGWHKTVEETCIVKNDVYIIMAICNGQLYGGTVCSCADMSRRIYNIDNVMFGRLKKVLNFFHISMMPSLTCSPLKGRGTHLLVKDDIGEEDKNRVLIGLLAQVEQMAMSKNMAVAFVGLNEKQLDLREKLSARGYSSTLDHPISLLDIKWSSFDDYRRDTKILSKAVRKNIRTQINRNNKAGVVISETQCPEEYGDRLHQLLSINSLKHNNLPFAFNRSFFEKLKKNMGNNACVFVAEKNGEVVGVKAILWQADFANSCFIGVDHDIAGNDFTYFNLAYYTSIKKAIQENIKTVDYGNGLYSVKTDRGCYIRRTYIYYRPVNIIQKIFLPLWFRVHAAWYERKASDQMRLHLR